MAPVKSFLALVVVPLIYAVEQPLLNFEVSPGPHMLGSTIHAHCATKGIYELPSLPMFNITVTKRKRPFFTDIITAYSTSESHMSIEGSFEASLEYDGSFAICQITTKTGQYSTKKSTLRIYKRKKRKVHVFEGDPVTLRCPVGDITRQEWVRTNKMDGHMVQVDDTSLQKDNVTVCGYHISTAQVADEGMYECYESDAVLQEVELTVNVMGELHFNITPGPYVDGKEITLTCEVPRVKGNVSDSNLQAFIGRTTLGKATRHHNLDRTQRLLLKEAFTIDQSYANKHILCLYTSPNSTIQQEAVIVDNQTLNSNVNGLYLGIIFAVLILVGVGVGVAVYVVPRCPRRGPSQQMHNPETVSIPMNRSLSQYDQIDESSIETVKNHNSSKPKKVATKDVNDEDDAYLKPTGPGKEQALVQKYAKRALSQYDQIDESVIKTINNLKLSDPKIVATNDINNDDDAYLKPTGPGKEQALVQKYAKREVTYENEMKLLNRAEDQEYEDMGQGRTGQSEPHYANDCTTVDGQRKEGSDVDNWLKQYGVSDETCVNLHRENIRTMSDFKLMTKEDIVHLNLSVGEMIRLREAMQRLEKE